MSKNASRVGALDLGIYSINKKNNFSFFDMMDDDKFKFIYLLGVDTFNFDKKNKFIVYQGSHGDKGAEIADIILPGAAYTEQDGYFTNLEGKLQKAYKASYPPGDAKEDWQIINDLAESVSNKKLFKNKDELESSLLNYLNLSVNKNLPNESNDTKDLTFSNEKIEIKNLDYYYSNSIARASKTMFECRSEKNKLKSTGTEG